MASPCRFFTTTSFSWYAQRADSRFMIRTSPDDLFQFYQQGGRLSEIQLMQACDDGEYDQLSDLFPLCVWQAYLNDDIPLRGFVELETVISGAVQLVKAYPIYQKAFHAVAHDMLSDLDSQRIEHYGKLDAWMADDAHFYWTLWQMTLSMTTHPEEALDLWIRQATTVPLRGPIFDRVDEIQFN